MKLTSDRIDQTLMQFDAQPVPENHPAVPQLSNLFGEHTFFLDQDGLNIVEVAEPVENGVETGRVVKLASWVDENRSKLAPHDPAVTDIVVVLGRAA